jgi:hypothetical protein
VRTRTLYVRYGGTGPTKPRTYMVQACTSEVTFHDCRLPTADNRRSSATTKRICCAWGPHAPIPRAWISRGRTAAGAWGTAADPVLCAHPSSPDAHTDGFWRATDACPAGMEGACSRPVLGAAVPFSYPTAHVQERPSA